MKIAAVVIDADINCRDQVRRYLRENCEQVVLAGEAATVKDAVELVKSVKPDMLLLDVEFPDGTAFELLARLDAEIPEIIFIATVEKYATEAFRAAASDYLLKPLAGPALANAIKRIINRINEKYFRQYLHTYLDRMQKKNYRDKRLAVSTMDGFLFVHLSEIIRLEAHANYTYLFLDKKRRIVSSKTLGYYEEILPAEFFCRIHHSHLVNMSFVEKYVRSRNGGMLILNDNTVLVVSQRKRNDVMEKFTRLGEF